MKVNNPKHLIAKQSAKGLVLFAIFPVIGLCVFVFNRNESVKWYHNNPFGFIFLVSVLSALTIFFLYKFFDTGTKLVINEKGIWTRKYKHISWNDIDAYHFEKRFARTVSVIFYIELRTVNKQLNMDITFLDINWEEIKNAIEANTAGLKIRYSGMSEVDS